MDWLGMRKGQIEGFGAIIILIAIVLGAVIMFSTMSSLFKAFTQAPGGSTANPFDQDLNTTSDVAFNSVSFGASSISEDGTYFRLSSPHGIFVGNYIDTASWISLQGSYPYNQFRWWDTTNNDGYDVSLYRLDNATLMIEAEAVNITGDLTAPNITATKFFAGTSAGITKNITIQKSLSATCSINITGGIITDSDC